MFPRIVLFHYDVITIEEANQLLLLHFSVCDVFLKLYLKIHGNICPRGHLYIQMPLINTTTNKLIAYFGTTFYRH